MTKPEQVDLFFTYRVKEGGEELFDRYLVQALALTETQEPYVLEYHLFRNADGMVLQHERYADEAAIRDHLRVTAAAQADWAAATDLLEFRAVGQLSEAFLQEFAIMPSQHFDRFHEVAR